MEKEICSASIDPDYVQSCQPTYQGEGIDPNVEQFAFGVDYLKFFRIDSFESRFPKQCSSSMTFGEEKVAVDFTEIAN